MNKQCCEACNGTKDITNSCIFCKTYISRNTDKILAEFDEKFPPFRGIGAPFPMFRETPVRSHIVQFLSESITQALAEERERVVDNIRFIYDNYWLDQKIQTSGNYKIVINREMFIKLLFSL